MIQYKLLTLPGIAVVWLAMSAVLFQSFAFGPHPRLFWVGLSFILLSYIAGAYAEMQD